MRTRSFLFVIALTLSFALVIGGASAVSLVPVEISVGACGATTLTATNNTGLGSTYLVVEADGVVQYVSLGGTDSISVGPFTATTTIYWRTFSAAERDYDQPLWNGYGGPSFKTDINAYGAANGWGWMLAGTNDPNPFTTWNAFDVEGCPPAAPAPAVPQFGCDLQVDVPSDAAVGTFLGDTLLYYAPGGLVSPETMMEAGQSLWVLGLDASDSYYKVILACGIYWVPVDSIGPNYDDVWNGTPLPTGHVE